MFSVLTVVLIPSIPASAWRVSIFMTYSLVGEGCAATQHFFILSKGTNGQILPKTDYIYSLL